MNALQLYRRYIGISFRSQMEYRFSFLMQTAAHFLITVVEFGAIWSLFLRFRSLQGWNFMKLPSSTAASVWLLRSVTRFAGVSTFSLS